MKQVRRTCLAALVAALCSFALGCSRAPSVSVAPPPPTSGVGLSISGEPTCQGTGNVIACVQMPATPQGGTSVAVTFTVQNTSTGSPAASILLISDSFSGTNANDFPITANTCPVGTGTPLQAGQNCMVTLTFKPSSSTIGPESALLNVTYQFSTETSSTTSAIEIMGTELAPNPQVSFSVNGVPSTTLAFSTTQLENMQSAPMSVTLTNTGSGNLTFTGTGVTVTGANATDFKIQSATCNTPPTSLASSTVAGGGTCSVGVTFTPTASPPGAETATLVFSDNAPGAPPLPSGEQGVTLTGTGIGAPTVTMISPGSGAQGTAVSVTITGTNFVSPATVTVSGAGVTVSNVVVASPTMITATFTISASATVSPPARTVTVTSNGSSPTTTFMVEPPAPTLSMLSVTSGTQGTNVGLTLTGTNFIATPTVPVTINVTQGGMPDGNVSPTNVVVSSSTTITTTLAISANATPGTVVISVTTQGGTTQGLNFSVLPQPSLSSINPNSGMQGTNVNVTLTGVNFTSPASISFSGSGITVMNGSLTVSNSTTITATFVIAANAPTGGQTVMVTTGGFTTMNAVQFTVNPPAPTLTGIVPGSGDQGTNVMVTLSGTNFFSPIQSINFNGGAAGAVGITVSSITVVSATQITATFALSGTATLGTLNVSVTTLGGTTGSQPFTVNPPVPTVSMLSATSGVQGTSVMLTVTGMNFVMGAGNTTITFSGTGITATGISVSSATSLTVTFMIASNAPAGSQTVFVNTAGGMSSSSVTFTVQSPLSANPSTLTFASTFVDCAATPTPTLLPSPCPAGQMITITNNSSSSLTSVSVPTSSTGSTDGTGKGEFAVTNNCPATLNPTGQAGSTCTLTVTFGPTSAGTRNPANDSITVSALLSGNAVSVTISPVKGTTNDWVYLTWTGDATDASFNVYRQNTTGSCVAPNSSTFHLIKSNVANVSNTGSTADTGLTAQTTYCYAVTGVNSNQVESALTSAPTVPVAIP